MGSALSSPVLTRSQRQDELVKMLPDGAAKVIRRPKTNPDGSDIYTSSRFDFPQKICDDHIEKLIKVFRLDPTRASFYFWQVREFCGIEVDLEVTKNSSATNSTLGEQN